MKGMGIYHVGDEDTTVKHIRPSASSSSCVVCISNVIWQRDGNFNVSRDSGKTPCRDGLLRHVFEWVNLVVRFDKVDLYSRQSVGQISPQRCGWR